MLGHSLVVLSDAHLGAARPTVEEDLLAFLETVPTLGDALLINGDLFEFWFSYTRVIPRHGFRVAAALARLRQELPIVMVGGNHDRWDQGFWQEDLGIDFAPEQATFYIGSRRILAIHGDGLTEHRWSSALLHRIIAHRATAATYRALHPDFGFRLVERLAPGLADKTQSEAAIQEGVRRQRRWAERTLAAEPDVDLVIMGHTHRPTLVNLDSGRQYLNPGAWFDGGRYAIVAEKGVELRTYNGKA